MARSEIQQNNGGPRGYGQREKSHMRQMLMRPEDEEVFGNMQTEGQEAAPNVYPAQPSFARPSPRNGLKLEDEGVSLGATAPMQHPRGAVQNRALNPSQGAAPTFGEGREGMNRGFSASTQGGQPNRAASQPGLMERVQVDRGANGEVTMDQVPASEGWQQRLNQSTQQPNGFAMGDPNRGALAQYGTGNIPGAGNVQTGNFMGQLEGFNTGGWGTGDRGTESIKNTVGRFMGNVDVTQPGAVQQLLAQPGFLDIFPMAQVVQHPNGDLIDFGDGNGPVDVIRGAVAGGSGAAWQWGAGGGQAPSGPGGPSAMAYQSGLPPMEQEFMNQVDPTSFTGGGMDQGATMEFLNWLMQQQQGQGQF